MMEVDCGAARAHYYRLVTVHVALLPMKKCVFGNELETTGKLRSDLDSCSLPTR